jgi:hypothetical protein
MSEGLESQLYTETNLTTRMDRCRTNVVTFM